MKLPQIIETSYLEWEKSILTKDLVTFNARKREDKFIE